MIITAADNKFEEIVKLSIAQTLKSNYKTHIYSINGKLSFGENFCTQQYNLDLINKLLSRNNQIIPIGRLPYKPYIIKEAMKYNEDLVWLDADAFIIKNIDEIHNDDSFDIGVTIRPQNECLNPAGKILNGFINAGVIFFKNNINTRNFINEWIQEIPETQFLSDQEALNRVILKYRPDIFNSNLINQVLNINGYKIKFFSTLDYNYYYYPDMPPESTKIIHIKNDIRRDNSSHEWFIKDWH